MAFVHGHGHTHHVSFFREIGETVFSWDLNFSEDQNVSPSFDIRATSTPEVETSTRMERFHLELSKLDDQKRFDLYLVKETPGEVIVLIAYVQDDSATDVGMQKPIWFPIVEGDLEKQNIGQLEYTGPLPSQTRIVVHVCLREQAIETTH
jgi:hypothetical protein